MYITLDEASNRLQRYKGSIKKSQTISSINYPQAAVLVVILEEDQELMVLLTVRSEQLKMNPGDVAFPGGKVEPGDEDFVQTALREAQEEVNICLGRESVISELPSIYSRMGIIVHPVIARLDSSISFKMNRKEVSEIFFVPLKEFLSSQNHHEYWHSWDGVPFKTHEFHVDGHRIWGLTANILINVASIIYDEGAEFDFNYELYRFDPPIATSKNHGHDDGDGDGDSDSVMKSKI